MCGCISYNEEIYSPQTWFEAVFKVGDQVVLLQHQLPVQVRDGEISQSPQTLQNPLLLFLRPDLRCQVTNIVLRQSKPFIQIADRLYCWNTTSNGATYTVSQIALWF